MKNAPRTIQGLNIFRLWLHYALYLCSFMDSYTFYTLWWKNMNLRLNQFAWKRVQTPALCRAGQPGKRDFFSCKSVPRRREFVKRIRDSASWANSVVMFSQSLCFKK